MRLGFYLNPIARLRGSYDEGEPDPVLFASIAEIAGVDIILIGWNPTGRIVTERDVKIIRELVKNDMVLVVPGSHDHIEPVVRNHPNGVILLPADWDGVQPVTPVQFQYEGDQLKDTISGYKSAGIPVSVFIDPDISNVRSCARSQVAGVVFDCANYSNARTDEEAEAALKGLENAAMAADKFGLVISFAHGLHYRNIGPVAALPFGEELYVGKSIVSRALVNGLDRAINDMKTTIFRSKLNN